MKTTIDLNYNKNARYSFVWCVHIHLSCNSLIQYKLFLFFNEKNILDKHFYGQVKMEIYFKIMINLLWKHILLKIVSIVTKEAGEIIDFLYTENKILRSKIDGTIKLTDYDRTLLVKYGMPIKDRLYEFISIVKPDTLLAWNR